MRRVDPWKLWIGNAGDVRDMASVRREGVEALVCVALDEVSPTVSRETIMLRFPLTDGGGNSSAVVRAAVDAVAGLIRAGIPTMVYCSAGMSRSPSVATAALSIVTGESMAECLCRVVKGAGGDISGGIWRQVVEARDRIVNLAKFSPDMESRPTPEGFDQLGGG